MIASNILTQYILQILPGLVLGVASLLFIKKKDLALRIFIYISIFLIFRDAMTPVKFWIISALPTYYIRFYELPILCALGALSVVAFFIINFYEPDLKRLIKWKMGSWISVICLGFSGAVLIALPAYIYGFSVPLDARGGVVLPAEMIMILLFSFCGNFLEEVLFRGYLQGFMELTMPKVRAAITCGILFSIGHIFLATSIPNAGIIIFAYTLYEGLICSFIRMYNGVFASTIAHALGIFLLASSLL